MPDIPIVNEILMPFVFYSSTFTIPAVVNKNCFPFQMCILSFFFFVNVKATKRETAAGPG